MSVVKDSFTDEDDESDHSALLERQDPPILKTCLTGIPWLPKEIGAPLAETKHMQNILNVFPEDDPRRKRRKDLYEAIVETFPAFLPARYHSMDSLALHENSKDGKYWANSTAFLLNSEVFGCTFLMDLNINLESEQDLTNNALDKSIFQRAKNSLFMDNKPEECKSAAEFLLEPWILLQVPFQPLLMQQWATGVLAEGLIFYREIVDLRLFVPKKMKKLIDPLFKMHNKIVECAIAFQTMGVEGGFHMEIMKHWNSLIAGKFAECIDILEFVLSDKCTNVVKALKRMAWSKIKSTNKSEHLVIYDKMHDFSSIPFYLNYHGFWRKKTSITSLQGSHTNWSLMLTHKELYQKRVETCASVKTLNANRCDIINFVKEKLLETGKIQGAKNVQDIFAKVNINQHLLTYLNFYNIYQTYSETCSKLKGAGIIYDITALHSDVVLAEVEAGIVKLIPSSAGISIRAVNCEGPEISLNQVKHTLSSVFSKTSCGFYKQLEQVGASFNPEHAEFPDYGQGAAEIAIHLQERVKQLVFSMIKRQLNNLKETSLNFYPESQFVQMVLPCFVASILDMDKDMSVNKDTKRKFTNFVHELIKSYENYEFCQKLTLQAKVPFSLSVSKKFVNIICLMLKDIEKALRNHFGASRVIDSILRMGPLFHLFKIMYDKTNYDCLVEWSFQMFMFANRMRDALSACFDVNICENYFEVCFIINCIENWVDLDPEDQQVFKVYNDRYKHPTETKTTDFNLTQHEVYKSANEISEMNLSGVLLFCLVKNLNSQRLDNRVFNGQGPAFAIDPVDSAFWHLYCGDLIKLKQCLKKTRQGDVDLYLVPIQVARSNACYKTVLRRLTLDGKVPMEQPGETTFFPVQHCRWCGLVEADAFLVCPMCADTPEYPDLNFFCSTHCQNEALEKQHQEEHVSFLMAKCGIR